MFSTNYQEVNDIIPAGVYEAMITSAKEDGKITIGLEIRKDVEQDCKGRGFTHWMYKLREPGDIDKQIDSYSYSQIMRIAKSARLPEGKSYAELQAYAKRKGYKPGYAWVMGHKLGLIGGVAHDRA